MMWLRVLVFLTVLCQAPDGFAHEVRPAFLEITQRADGRADVLWKQPSQGQLAVALRPHLSGGGIETPATQTVAADNFEIRRWIGITLDGKGLGGREVWVDGLDKTITDVLVLVHLPGGDQITQILTPAQPSFTIDAHAGAAVGAYLRLGIEHILTGIDHLLFVFGLILLSDRFRSLLKTITAFTVAHSITLAATALKLLRIDPHLVEAMVAFSILFLAVELVRKYRGKTGLTLRYPWLIAFGFGLLHGAAFAGALKEIGLPEGNIPLALFLFNVGVEIGQLMFVAAIGGVLWLLRQIRWPSFAPAAARIAATYAIGSFSMFWFLERLHVALVSA